MFAMYVVVAVVVVTLLMACTVQAMQEKQPKAAKNPFGKVYVGTLLKGFLSK